MCKSTTVVPLLKPPLTKQKIVAFTSVDLKTWMTKNNYKFVHTVGSIIKDLLNGSCGQKKNIAEKWCCLERSITKIGKEGKVKKKKNPNPTFFCTGFG